VAQGTLDSVILKTLARGRRTVVGITVQIQQMSDEVLRVDQRSVYDAAPHRAGRLDQLGVGVSGNNRKAASCLRRAQYTQYIGPRGVEVAAMCCPW
jgi:hypothetical protein